MAPILRERSSKCVIEGLDAYDRREADKLTLLSKVFRYDHPTSGVKRRFYYVRMLARECQRVSWTSNPIFGQTYALSTESCMSTFANS